MIEAIVYNGHVLVGTPGQTEAIPCNPERQAALRLREMVTANAPRMPELNGRGPAFWQIPDRTPLYIGR